MTWKLPSMSNRLIIFRRRLGWYWRLVARNGRILAVGAEPFASKRNARRAFATMYDVAWEVVSGG